MSFTRQAADIGKRAVQFACLTLGILAGVVILALGEGLVLKLSGVSWSPKQSLRHVSVGDFSISASGRWGVSRVAFARERSQDNMRYEMLIHDIERNGAKRLYLDSYEPLTVALSPAADQFAIGAVDGSVYVARLSSGNTIEEIAVAPPRRLRMPDPDDGIGDVAFSPDGTILAAASQTRVWIWRMPSGELLHSIPNAIHRKTDLTFSRNSRLILFGGADGVACLCDVRSGRRVETVDLGTEAVVAAALSPDARRAAFVTMEGRLCMWSFDEDREIWRENVSNIAPRRIAFSPDAQLVATAECGIGSRRIQMVDAATGKPVGDILDAADTMGLVFCSDGLLCAWDCRGGIRAWNVDRRREQWRFSAAEAADVFGSIERT